MAVNDINENSSSIQYFQILASPYTGKPNQAYVPPYRKSKCSIHKLQDSARDCDTYRICANASNKRSC